MFQIESLVKGLWQIQRIETDTAEQNGMGGQKTEMRQEVQ